MEKQDCRVSTGLIWLRIGIGDAAVNKQNKEHFRYTKCANFLKEN